jgi:hypothetical protein
MTIASLKAKLKATNIGEEIILSIFEIQLNRGGDFEQFNICKV